MEGSLRRNVAIVAHVRGEVVPLVHGGQPDVRWTQTVVQYRLHSVIRRYRTRPSTSCIGRFVLMTRDKLPVNRLCEGYLHPVSIGIVALSRGYSRVYSRPHTSFRSI